MAERETVVDYEERVVRELKQLRDFLNGSALLRGVSFGEKPAHRENYGAFWWREHLDRIDAALALLAERRELRKALAGIDADYMTSERHHPGYVLIPTAKFEQLRSALSTTEEKPPK